jgi:hypothetical protein
MPNRHLIERLAAVQDTLLALYRGGKPMSSATKGREREYFIHEFLEQILPPVHRFGSGDIIDSHGHKTGQIDIVIEHPFLPSLPQLGGRERLYLAESVAAVIEVKSDLSSQWDEVEKTAREIRRLKRPFNKDRNPPVSPGVPGYPDPITVFAVGYKGWAKLETLRGRFGVDALVNGILVIEGGLWATYMMPTYRRPGLDESRGIYQVNEIEGPMALWGLFCSLQQVIHGVSDNGEWIKDYVWSV